MVDVRRKGIRYEYKVRDIYRKKGCYVVRSAGSKGLFDLIAIHPELKKIYLIQCKAGNITKKEKKTILEALSSFKGTYEVLSALH